MSTEQSPLQPEQSPQPPTTEGHPSPYAEAAAAKDARRARDVAIWGKRIDVGTAPTGQFVEPPNYEALRALAVRPQGDPAERPPMPYPQAHAESPTAPPQQPERPLAELGYFSRRLVARQGRSALGRLVDKVVDYIRD